MNAKTTFSAVQAAVHAAYGENAPRTELELFDAMAAIAAEFSMPFPDGERERFADQAARVSRTVTTTVRGASSRTASTASANTVWRALAEHVRSKGTKERAKELREAYAQFATVARFAAGVGAVKWEGEE